MTEFIVRLEKEQIRQERRKLLSDDVYVLAHDVLKQAHKDKLTSLTQVELYLSGKHLAQVLLSLPNVEEGIEDELEELEEMEAENKDEAVIVGMIAAAIINANGSSHNRDITPIVLPIFRRWGGHRLCIPILEAMQIKEEKRWMEGKRTNLLSCTLEETTSEGEEEVEDLLQNFLDDCDMWEPTTFKDFFLDSKQIQRRPREQIPVPHRRLEREAEGQDLSAAPAPYRDAIQQLVPATARPDQPTDILNQKRK